MINYEQYCKIHDYYRNQHLTVAQIARELHLHPCTVAKWVARDKFHPRKAPPRPSMLDPFKGQIVAFLQTHPYTATQIFLRLRESGYTGGITIVSPSDLPYLDAQAGRKRSIIFPRSDAEFPSGRENCRV